jgi:tellurium resistance protein TerZ
MAISLKKNEGISLKKMSDVGLTNISFGLGWDPIRSKPAGGFMSSLFGSNQPSYSESVDLDANCTMYDANGNLVDAISFQKLISSCGGVRHSGDNRTGAGDGDDETITIDLNKIPSSVKSVVFSINSFSGQNFSRVESISCNIYDNAKGKTKVATYSDKVTGSNTAIVVAKLVRTETEWVLTPVSVLTNGRTYRDITPAIKSII